MFLAISLGALLFLSFGDVHAQSLLQEPYTVTVPPTSAWTNTGLTLTTGDSLIIYAIGAWDANLENYAWDGWTGPEGHGRGWPLTTQPCSTCPVMSLIGKIGDNSPFFVGRFRYVRADTDGVLYLACNDEDDFDNSGVMTAFIWWKVHITEVLEHGSQSPLGKDIALLQNKPNPFHDLTKISYSVNSAGLVNIRIYDASGRLIKILEEDKKEPGSYTAYWDGRDGSGDEVASGTYFYQLSLGDRSSAKKAVVVK